METRPLILLALCVARAEPLSEAMQALRPLDQALKSRSDAFGAYANDYTQEYEPVAYAAIPLHHPMPVIAILSDNPLSQNGAKTYGQKIYAPSANQHSYTNPDFQQNFVPKEYSQYSKPQETEHQSPYAATEYQKPYTDYPKYAAVDYVKPYAPVEFAKTYAPVEYAKPYAPIDYKPYPSEYVKNYAPLDYRPYSGDYVKPYASVEAPTILYARPTKNGGYTYRRPQKQRHAKRPRKEKPMVIRVHRYRVIRSRRSGY